MDNKAPHVRIVQASVNQIPEYRVYVDYEFKRAFPTAEEAVAYGDAWLDIKQLQDEKIRIHKSI